MKWKKLIFSFCLFFKILNSYTSSFFFPIFKTFRLERNCDEVEKSVTITNELNHLEKTLYELINLILTVLEKNF